jgi:hypothetical protein
VSCKKLAGLLSILRADSLELAQNFVHFLNRHGAYNTHNDFVGVHRPSSLPTTSPATTSTARCTWLLIPRIAYVGRVIYAQKAPEHNQSFDKEMKDVSFECRE